MKIGFWILLALIIIIFSYFRKATLFYGRFVVRNSMLKALADEFSLQFESKMPNFLKFIIIYNFSHIQLNEIRGTVNRHAVLIKDTFYSSVLFLDNRQTFITIDGQSIGGNLKDLTLGSRFILTPIDELRDLLKSKV